MYVMILKVLEKQMSSASGEREAKRDGSGFHPANSSFSAVEHFSFDL
jgi:hypothetical protein